MSRVVLERWGPRIAADLGIIEAERRLLASTEPPHLEESPPELWAWLPDATGRCRYRLRVVMNTEKGARLVSP